MAAPAEAAPNSAAVFRLWDANHDGFLSRAEWLAQDQTAEGFAYTDTNHDRRITPAELKVVMAKAKAKGILR